MSAPLTPADVEATQFTVVETGYDMEQVDAFLDQVKAGLEILRTALAIREAQDEADRQAAEVVAEDARPRRGDDVEAWLLRARSEFFLPGTVRWRAATLLLDDYRERADLGIALDAEKEGGSPG